MPPAGRYLWDAFSRLSRRRPSGGFGVSTITWEGIDAFARNSGLRLAPWEIEVIEYIEDLFMAEQAKAHAQSDKNAGGGA